MLPYTAPKRIDPASATANPWPRISFSVSDRPDAAPLSSGFTVHMVTVPTWAITKPEPIPSNSMPGNRSMGTMSVEAARPIIIVPAIIPTNPATRIHFGGMRLPSLGVVNEKTATHAV